jgi:hypothetical protein
VLAFKSLSFINLVNPEPSRLITYKLLLSPEISLNMKEICWLSEDKANSEIADGSSRGAS